MNNIIIYLKQIILLSVIFLLVDAGYLYLMKNKFTKLIENIQNSRFKLDIIPTIFCYIFLISLLYYFIICKSATLIDAFFLGLFTYGVYETTNMAIFKNWKFEIAIIDIIWGGILFLTTIYLYRFSVVYI